MIHRLQGLQVCLSIRDVKRGQMLEAEAEAKHLRPRSRSRPGPSGRGRGQLYEAEAETEATDYNKYVKILGRKQRIIFNKSTNCTIVTTIQFTKLLRVKQKQNSELLHKN